MSMDNPKPLRNAEGPENEPILALRLRPELRRTLENYAQIKFTSFSLVGLLQRRDQRQAQKDMEAELLKRGMVSPDNVPDSIADPFSEMYEQIVAGKNTDIKVRWVSANSEDELQRIVEGAAQNGGKADSLIGLCVDVPGGKGDDTMRTVLSRGDTRGVLFIYNASKLEPLTQTESRSHSHFYAGYGVKPVQGETYRSALLGAIVI